MQRDRKGTYQRGQRGESNTVPGLQVPYESPVNPELRIDTSSVQEAEAARRILEFVKDTFLSPAP